MTVVSGTKCKTLLNIFISEKKKGKEGKKTKRRQKAATDSFCFAVSNTVNYW